MSLRNLLFLIFSSVTLVACNELESETAILHTSECLVDRNGYFKEISAYKFYNKNFKTSINVTAEKVENAYVKARSVQLKFSKRNSESEVVKAFVDVFQKPVGEIIKNDNQPISTEESKNFIENLISKLKSIDSSMKDLDKGQLKKIENIPEMTELMELYFKHVIELAGGEKFQLFDNAKVGLFFSTSDNCQNNSFEVDPKTVSESTYKGIKDKKVLARIYKFKQFDKPVYLRQVHKPSKLNSPYEYDFFFPVKNNRFVSYTIKDARLIVMAMYGDVWFDDWLPGEDDVLALDNELSGIGQGQNTFKFRKFDKPEIKGIEQNYPAVYNVYMKETFLFGQKSVSRTVETQAANAKMIKDIVTLLNGFEEGTVNLSQKIADAGTRKFFEFIPDPK